MSIMLQSRFSGFDLARPITAIVYVDGQEFETVLAAMTEAMARSGMRLAGLIHCTPPGTAIRKCNLHVQDLATGELHGISDDRGPHVRGCMLDTDRLLRAAEAARLSLTADVDLLVVCKFGKTEVAGGGLCALMADALDLSIPVLIGVPAVNLDAFRAFSGDLACEVDVSEFGRAHTLPVSHERGGDGTAH